MHLTLARQLKRIAGVSQGDALELRLQELGQFLETHEAPPELRKLAQGLPDFLARVEATYQQFDRDLELRSRSLKLSSDELLGINEQLRQTLENRETAITQLQGLAKRLRSAQPDGQGNGEDEPGSISSLIGLITSLVERQEAHQREMQALHMDLANQKFALDQHAIVSITDLEGRITYANDRFCQITGYTREELLGTNHRIVRSSQHPPEFFAELWQTISSGRVWHGEIRNRAKNGDQYWVNATIVPLMGADGLPTQYIAIRTDITERKQIEARLAEQLHFTEFLIESLPTALYLKDAEGRYMRFNRAFENLFGIDRNQFLGKTVFDLVPTEMAAMMHAKDEVLLREGGIQTYEARYVNRKTGFPHDGLYWKARLTRADGSIAGLVGSILDITDRKRFEQELQNAKLAAEAASLAKSDFLANMSHEIRTPMNGIIGMTDLALDTDLDATQRDYLNIVRNSAESLMTIVNDILDFSKIEAGKLSIEHIPFNLPVTLAESLKSIAARAEMKGLRLVCDLPAELTCRVSGDPGRIRQVLLNLCDNAIKFTQSGEITVRAVQEQTDTGQVLVRITVSDTGIGIPKDKQQQIFDAFTQADTSTTRKFGGTGLGLTICARLISLMGGRIWVESEPGRGSAFHFSIYLTRVHDTIQESASLPPLTTWPGMRALVVDDHPVNRRGLIHWLKAWGFQVDEASDGQQALDKCRFAHGDQSGYKVVLLDANMPVMDGFCFVEQARAAGLVDGMRFIMLTSGGIKGDAQRCQDLGLAAYLTKPATPVELRETLTRILSADRPPALVTRHSLKEHRRSLSILVVEDNQINQRLATEMLEKWGHRVTLAGNGQEAVKLFPAAHWDMVFMDMQMPVMGGIEATALIRAQEPPGRHTPIVAMTANAMAEDRQRCLDAGMDDHLSKPIRRDAVHRLLERYGARASLPAPPSDPVGDRQAIETGLAAADPEIFETIRDIALVQLSEDIANARDALANSDWNSLQRNAHNLKSTFLLFEVQELAQLAQQVESAPSRTTADMIDRLAAAVDLIATTLAGGRT